MINILISVNENYIDKAETMLHSFRRNNSEDVTVYLMNHCLCDTAIKKFRKYLQSYLKMGLEVLNISMTVFDQLPLGCGQFSIEMYYRLLAQFLLPESVDRIIWLDADIVICGNVGRFYHQNFEGNLLVACPDVACKDKEIIQIKKNLGLPKEHIYFNSGVLLLNLEELRKKTNIHEIELAARNIAKYLVYPDQDLLNYLYTVIATSKWQISNLLACPKITLYTVISIQKGNGPREPQSRLIPCSLRPSWYKTVIIITYTSLIYKKESDIFM